MHLYSIYEILFSNLECSWDTLLPSPLSEKVCHLVKMQWATIKFFLLCFCDCLAVNIKSKDKRESEILPAEAMMGSVVLLTGVAIEILVSTIRNENLTKRYLEEA